MKKENFPKVNIKLILIGIFLQVAITLLFIAFFSVIMYFFETDKKYSPVFGSIAVAAGAFISSYFVSTKRKNKGYLNGLIVGGITFILLTLIGLIIDDDGITINTLFHLIIIILSAVTGGILGVNGKKNFLKGKF